MTKVNNTQACAYHLRLSGIDKFYVCAAGYAWAIGGHFLGSDSIFKQNIKTIENPLNKIKLLRGVEYNFKDEALAKERRLGFIAQEVEKILPGVVKTMYDSTKAISYTDIIGLLVEGIKEQQQEIEILKLELENLQYTINECCETANIRKSAKKSDNEEQEQLSFLEQNIPNPFNESSKIRYIINENAVTAKIFIFNLQGQLQLTKDITNIGEGSITINASELEAGMYVYSLIVDGKEIDTKKLILTK
ncbi:MAG: tail fiber domain-containing protein [Bacteroidales bacterium]|jgi:hypothetical protein|nr:tail fiber domain-containing protein [Bacteroidales bacterium]